MKHIIYVLNIQLQHFVLILDKLNVHNSNYKMYNSYIVVFFAYYRNESVLKFV